MSNNKGDTGYEVRVQKNFGVIPNEFVVSYYGNYPEYLVAGTMAIKMFT